MVEDYKEFTFSDLYSFFHRIKEIKSWYSPNHKDYYQTDPHYSQLINSCKKKKVKVTGRFCEITKEKIEVNHVWGIKIARASFYFTAIPSNDYDYFLSSSYESDLVYKLDNIYSEIHGKDLRENYFIYIYDKNFINWLKQNNIEGDCYFELESTIEGINQFAIVFQKVKDWKILETPSDDSDNIFEGDELEEGVYDEPE